MVSVGVWAPRAWKWIWLPIAIPSVPRVSSLCTQPNEHPPVFPHHLRWLCPFLLPIFTHCMSTTYFNFSLPTAVKNYNTAYCVAVYQQKWFLPCFEFAGTKYHYKLNTRLVHSATSHPVLWKALESTQKHPPGWVFYLMGSIIKNPEIFLRVLD